MEPAEAWSNLKSGALANRNDDTIEATVPLPPSASRESGPTKICSSPFWVKLASPCEANCQPL
jgi:hypothetical protein